MKAFLEQLLHEVGPSLLTGLLGSVVALAYMQGLTWREQVAATFAGAATAGAVSWALQDLFHLSTAVAGGLSFVIGLVAFRATPALTSGVARSFENLPAYVSDLLQAVTDRIRSFGGPK